MRSLLHLCLIVAAHAAVVRRDITYSQNVRDSTLAQSFGAIGQNTTVNAGVQVWLSGGTTHNWFGNVNNFGTIINSQTDYFKLLPANIGLISTWTGADPTNGNLVNNAGALISLNDFAATTGPTFTWTLNTMENYGNIQWCGRGDLLGSQYQLYCGTTKDCHNYGVIDWEQYYGNNGALFNWRSGVSGTLGTGNLYNEGAFRLVNVAFHNTQNVYGQGCWVIDQASTLYLETTSGTALNPTRGPVFPNQKIYFTNAVQAANKLQTLHIDPFYLTNSNFGAQVYNFGSGMAIELSDLISTFSYANGVLTISTFTGGRVNINLGTGYTSSSFYKANNPTSYNPIGFNAIFYRGAAPSQTVPAVCSVSLPKCADPAITAAVSSTTTTVAPTVTSTTTVNAVYVTVTSVYRGTGTIAQPSATTIAQPTGAAPGTVVVYYNPNTVTITSLDGGNTVRTSVIAQQNGITAGTVQVLLPGYTTITTVYRGAGTIAEPSTSTVAQPTGTVSGTVDVFYNPKTVTITSLDAGDTTRTTTLAEQTGPTAGTVEILIPGYTTITTVYRGTGTIAEPSSTTVALPIGTTSGTVDVFYNPRTTTITSLDSGNTPRTTTLAEQTGLTPGTVQVLLPGYTTITAVYRGTGSISPEPSISTIAQPAGTTLGTVDVFYNPRTVTITSLDSGDTTRTTTLAEQTGLVPGTVQVLLPGYITVTSIYSGTGTISPEPSTTTVAQPTGAVSGTVNIFYNPRTVTITSIGTGAATITTTLAQQTGLIPGTVEVLVPPAGYITVTGVYAGPGTISPNPSTTTVAQATGSTSGTVNVLYNPSTITITSFDNGDTTRTSTLAQQTGSTPGTVAIIEPSYIRRTSIYNGPGTNSPDPSTSTVAQPVGSTQGTLDIYYNPNTVTITSLDNGDTTRTITLAQQTGSQAGTVEILQPSYVTTTITTGSVAYTSTISQPIGTTQGTVVVAVAPSTTVIVSFPFLISKPI